MAKPGKHGSKSIQGPMATYCHRQNFFKHFPDAKVNELAKTIDPYTKLYAYNQIEIRQLGVCELMVQYQSRYKICKFYVVDFPTAILGIHDSENLKLITVHVNSVESEKSQVQLHELLSNNPTAASPLYVNAVASDDKFTVKIMHDDSDLFIGTGNMNTKIDIKLTDNAI